MFPFLQNAEYRMLMPDHVSVKCSSLYALEQQYSPLEPRPSTRIIMTQEYQI